MSNNEFKHALPMGSVIEGYQVESVLGSGGFGITYQAIDIELQHQVAIKEYLPVQLAWRVDSTQVVPKSAADNESYHFGLKQFVDEGRTLAKFKHQNIVRVVRYFEANGTAYLVMEYEHGQSLKEYLAQNPRPAENTLLSMLVALLAGLATVHEQKYLHRDLKPGNIYIRNNGQPVLLDFGSAREALNQQSQSLTRIVTEGYAPFEQYPGSIKQTPATDLYALGATLYFAVIGRSPTNAMERFNNLQLKKKDLLVPASKAGASLYSPAFLKLIDWMLEIFPQDRPQSVDKILQLISNDDKTVTGESLTVAIAAIPRRKKIKASHKIAWLIGSLVLLLSGLGAGVYTWQRSSTGGDTGTSAEKQPPSPVLKTKDKQPVVTGDIKKPEPAFRVTKGPTQFVFKTDPTGADVYINKQLKGKTPLVTGPLSPGIYTIKLAQKDFKPYSSAILLQKGFTTYLTQKLKPANLRKLKITPTPGYANIEFLNPKLKYSNDLYVKPGQFKVRISAKNHVTQTLDMDISYADRDFNVVLKHKNLIRSYPVKDFVRTLAIQASSNNILADISGQKVKLINLETGKVNHQLPRNFRQVSGISANGRYTLVNQMRKLRVFDLKTRKFIKTIATECNDLYLWSPVGNQFGCTSSETLEIWNALTAKKVTSMKRPDSIEFFSFSADGKQVLFVDQTDKKTVNIVQLADQKLLFSLKGYSWEFVAAVFSPKGDKVLTATDDGKLRLWDLATAKPILTLAANGNIVVNQIAISADGNKAISVGIDHSILYWDLKTGERLAQLSGHTELVNTITFADHDQKIVSGGHDKTIKVWDISKTNLE